jgi:hypothetical protein
MSWLGPRVLDEVPRRQVAVDYGRGQMAVEPPLELRSGLVAHEARPTVPAGTQELGRGE